MSKSLAVKYRPQNWESLVGQEVPTTIIKGMFLQKKVVPFLIFRGPRGSGKTTAARLFSLTLGCTEVNSPCLECPSCLLIKDGHSRDVIEVDAATNNGVDFVRSLVSRLQLAPQNLTCKVVILDEAHALTSNAFQALLKILEEPPKNTYFIMATTEGDKIPETISSRAFVLDFRRISILDIVGRLRFIADEEKIDISSASLHRIAVNSRGGMRDAITSLETVCLLGLTSSPDEATDTLFSAGEPSAYNQLLTCIFNKDKMGVYQSIDTSYKSGVSFNDYVDNLVLFMSSVIAFQVGVIKEDIYNVPCTNDSLTFLCSLASFSRTEKKPAYVKYSEFIIRLVESLD